MPGISARWWCAALFCVAVGARAQVPDVSVAAALQSLHARAGVVFGGEVRSVQRRGGTVEVVFGVDVWLKGGAGPTYVLREWPGLWAANEQRYRVGERALVFLHPVGVGSVSSPVDGLDGVLPLAQTATAGDAAAAYSVDRLRTRVVRAMGTAMTGAPGPMSLAAIRQALARIEQLPEPIARPLPVQTPDVISPEESGRAGRLTQRTADAR